MDSSIELMSKERTLDFFLCGSLARFSGSLSRLLNIATGKNPNSPFHQVVTSAYTASLRQQELDLVWQVILRNVSSDPDES